MGHAERKLENLQETERLLMDRRWGVTELAAHLGVSRQTVYSYLDELRADQDEEGRYWIDRRRFISHISLSLDEALVVYLALRRLQRLTWLRRDAVAGSLSKVARALGKPMIERMVEAANRMLDQEQAPAERELILAELVKAWANGLVLNLRYRGLGREQPFDDRFRCYLIEPSPWGDGVYLIGHSQHFGKVVTYKVERILHASTSGEEFKVPADFSEQAIFDRAWGIWAGEGEPTQVRLRFPAGSPADRVRESIWHGSASRSERDDGGCELKLEIGELLELIPWLRSWGSDVEVMEPESLKHEMAQQALHLAEQRGVLRGADEQETRLLMLWGKTDKRRDWRYHPALYHLLDVAHIAQQLLSSRASPRWRMVLGTALGADPAALHTWLPWLIALHDLGKLTADFQAQNAVQKQRLQQLGFDFGRVRPTNHLHHTLLGWLLLEQSLPTPFSPALAEIVKAMIGGHHGVYNRPSRDERQDWRNQAESAEWGDLRCRAIELLQGYLLLDPVPHVQPPNRSAALALLNGFAILCDWLGSDEEFFQPMSHLPLHRYVLPSRAQARARVEQAGFFAPVTSRTPATFAALFPTLPAVRPLQAAAEQIPDALLDGPSLTIAEAPTGEGKTEFAQLLARRIAARTGGDEFYVALPTMATSNAMFQRVQRHLRDNLGLANAQARLIHGQDFLVKDSLELEPMDNGEGESPPSLEWFTPKKRALLAPFGVGTVDQAMYTALNSRHNALRLIGLAGKVVILDEIHAYDSYMSLIIERLLRWLGQCGTSVILLSATLPLARRQRLLAAYTGQTEIAAPPNPAAYPSILTISHGGRTPHQETPASANETKRTTLAFLAFRDDEAEAKAHWLLDQVAEGGCACWITNTVRRAQALFAALVAEAARRGWSDLALTLLHARFPLVRRQKRERRLLARYGPEAEDRPKRGIVIGTQVLEQSLDVDFDLMVSDHAPIDLLLQREGRLHRHERAERPAHLTPARLYLNAVTDEAGEWLPGDEKFYDEYIMRRSWQVLRGRERLSLPADYRPLVEAVYSEQPPEEPTLRATFAAMLKEREKAEQEAKVRIIAEPDPEEPFCYQGKPLFGEDEESQAWNIAQTRLGEPSMLVIPLGRDGEWATWGKDKRVATTGRAEREDQMKLLKFSVRLSHPTVVNALTKQGDAERTALFTESPLLRHAQPLWLTDGSATLTADGRRITVRLDPVLGICYE